jgi:hypothetical protein
MFFVEQIFLKNGEFLFIPHTKQTLSLFNYFYGLYLAFYLCPLSNLLIPAYSFLILPPDLYLMICEIHLCESIVYTTKEEYAYSKSDTWFFGIITLF